MSLVSLLKLSSLVLVSSVPVPRAWSPAAVEVWPAVWNSPDMKSNCCLNGSSDADAAGNLKSLPS